MELLARSGHLFALERRLALLAVTALLATGACAEVGEETRHNVVFILADDLGWSDLGSYGSTFHRTPHLDRLAREGMLFTEAYAASPVCSPSRAAILTGLSPARLLLTRAIGPGDEESKPGEPDRVRGQEIWAPMIRPFVPRRVGSFSRRLRDAGYRLGFIGKWHLGGMPGDYGFHVSIGASFKGKPKSHFSPYGIPELADGPPGEYLTDRLTEEAIAFIESSHGRGRPFFLFLSHYAVHSPFEAPAELVAPYEGRVDPRATQRNPTYAAMIQSIDDGVGRILATLAELGLAQETVVVFTSDNGALTVFEDDDEEPVYVTSNAPLRGGKRDLYEGGVRVPAIVRGPVVASPGSTCDVPIVGTDFHPTILALAGLRPEKPLDGVDLTPVLAGTGWLAPRSLFFHYPHPEMASSIRHGSKKLIRFYADDRLELYDLADDPGEDRDLAPDQPELAARLEDELDRWLADVGAHFPTPNPFAGDGR